MFSAILFIPKDIYRNIGVFYYALNYSILQFSRILPLFAIINSERRDIMERTRNINKKICEMRQSLQDLINEKPSLLDSEVIIASQELDEALNEYNNLLNKVDK